jgi:ribosomal subunit interface protein
MLQKFEISGVHPEISDNLRKYATKKLGRIDKYLSKSIRGSAHLEVRLKEGKENGRKVCTCNVIMHLPHETIKIGESTINMFAAVDIVHAKLKQQIEKYKESHTAGGRQRRLFNRARRLNILPGRNPQTEL